MSAIKSIILEFCVLLLMLLSMAGCSNGEDALFIYEQEVFFEIPAGLNTLETHFFQLFNVPSDLQLQLDSRGISQENVARVLSNRGLITARFDNLDWNMVERVIVNVLDREDPTRVTEIFYQEFVPLDTGQEIRLLANISNLKEVLLPETIDLEIRLDFRAFPPANIETRFFFSFAAFDGE